jgi:hypothetical protein
MTMTALSPDELAEFEEVVEMLEAELSDKFTMQRKQFMKPGLEYADVAFFPLNPKATRISVRGAVERALDNRGIPIAHERHGKGVYMNDIYHIRQLPVVLSVGVARRGGLVITFQHESDQY